MKRSQQNGVTLVALVVTIIVLLILAGVAINLTIGNNGLFTRTQNAANTWKMAEVNEQKEMKNFEELYDNTLIELGMGEINFTLNGKPYKVKNGTTWNEFFCENFHDDYNWAYTIGNREIVRYIDDYNGTQAYFSYLVNEQNENQKIDNKIKSKNYIDGITDTFRTTDVSIF